jgi:hypothetical protein
VDYSIAINQVMQGTSWQVAGAALDQLLPSVAPVGSPLAMTTNTGTIYKPVNLFRTNADDNVLRGVLNPYPDGSQPTFACWHPMDGALRSVAARRRYGAARPRGPRTRHSQSNSFSSALLQSG